MDVKAKKNQNPYPRMIILTVIFVIFTVAVVCIYRTKFNEKNRSTLLEQLALETAQYSANIRQELLDLDKLTVPVVDLLEQGTVRKKERAMQTMRNTTQASSVALLDLNGTGLDEDGNAVTLDLSECIETLESGTGLYYHLDDNTIVLLKPIIKADRVNQILSIQYDISGFDSLLAGFDFGKESWIAVIDDTGEIIYYFSEKPSHYLTDKENLYEVFAESAGTSAEAVRKEFFEETDGTRELDFGKDKRQIFYQSLGINDWYVVTGIPDTYMNTQLGLRGQAVKRMTVLVLTGSILFALAIIIFNTADKYSSKVKREGLTRLAETDQLTGLYNKVTTEKKIKEFLAENPETQSLMFVLDIDNFKKINDTMGHAFGDEVLRTIGQRIRMEFRASDIIGRAGGDEFIILLKGLKDDEIILKEARKVERFFKEFKAGNYVKYSATASIGCAVFPRDAADFDGLYKAADQALYRAKQRGKNQLAFYKEIEDVGQSVEEIGQSV
jgi:diguanylate cyclase (GGDEF)-like protein